MPLPTGLSMFKPGLSQPVGRRRQERPDLWKDFDSSEDEDEEKSRDEGEDAVKEDSDTDADDDEEASLKQVGGMLLRGIRCSYNQPGCDSCIVNQFAGA